MMFEAQPRGVANRAAFIMLLLSLSHVRLFLFNFIIQNLLTNTPLCPIIAVSRETNESFDTERGKKQ